MLQVTVKIKNSKEAEFKKGFLHVHPVPQIKNPDGSFTAKLSEQDWITDCVKSYLLLIYAQGKRTMSVEAGEIEKDLFD